MTRRIKPVGLAARSRKRRKKLHNEEIFNSYFSPNVVNMIISRENEKGGMCSTHGREEKLIKDLVGTVKDKLISRYVGGSILLKRISQTEVKVQTGFV
jgi:hypothetical protein